MMTENVFMGKAHVYDRAHINTDEIIPARYLTSDKENELAKYAMEDIDKDFVSKVSKGDFIVAGEDFGCGSSREHAVWALRGAGVRLVIADSFARIFYRNCINNGFLAIECKGASKRINSEDELEINVSKGLIFNKTKNEKYSFPSMPDFAMEIINDGGLMKHIKSKKFEEE